MRVLIASDLHFEFHRDGGKSLLKSMPDADVLACAGDLSSAGGLWAAIHRLCQRYKHVVFVAGNHEFYGANIPEVRALLQRLDEEIKGFHYLECGTCEIEGVRFVGATLWFRKFEGIERLYGTMNDFHIIKDAQFHIYDENRRAISFLEETLTPEDVVLTHHLPAQGSIAEPYVGSALNCFFLCDVEPLIRAKQPRYWIHGHTHFSADYRIDKTRVLCNPFGYAGREPNPTFREDLLIDL